MKILDSNIDLNSAWEKAREDFFHKTGHHIQNGGISVDQLIATIEKERAGQKKVDAKLDRIGSLAVTAMKTGETILAIINSVASSMFGAPCSMCMNAISFLVQGAVLYRKMYDDLEKVIDTVLDALKRFNIYLSNQKLLSPGMKQIANEILLQFVEVSKLNYEIMSRGKMKRALAVGKTLLDKSDSGVTAALDRLTKLANRESQYSAADTHVSLKLMQQDQKIANSETKQSLTVIAQKIHEDDYERQMRQVHEKLGQPEKSHRPIWQSDLENAVQETGQWLNEIDPYKAWFNDKQCQKPFILLSGAVDSGKTYLFSTIVKSLLSKHPPGHEELNSCSVAYYYFRKVETNKDAREKERRETMCTVSGALRSLAYQFAEDSPRYRQKIQNLRESLDSLSVLELWHSLFTQLDTKSTHFLLLDGVHDLEPQQVSLMTDLLGEIFKAGADLQPFKVLITGRPNLIECFPNDPAVRPPTVNISEHNTKDITSYIRWKVSDMPLLRQRNNEDICIQLTKNANGDFRYAGNILDQLNGIETENDVKHILEASKDKLETVAQQIERANATLSQDNKQVLNHLLEWTFAAFEAMDCDGLQQVLDLRSKTQFLSSLRERLDRHFAGFFVMKKDRWGGEQVTLVQSVRDHIIDSDDDDDDANLSLATTVKVNPAEVQIVKRLLQNMCDDDLYARFEFGDFFNKKLDSSSRIGIAVDHVHGKVALDCLTALVRHDDETDYASYSIRWYAIAHFAEHLKAANLALLDKDLKGKIGQKLITLFRNERVIKSLLGDFQASILVLEDEHVDLVQAWLGDAAVTKPATSEDKAWVERVIQDPRFINSNAAENLLEHMARQCASMWLSSEYEEDLIWSSVASYFRWLRAYVNKVHCSEAIEIERMSRDDYWDDDINIEEIQGVLEWTENNTSVTMSSYISLCCLGETFLAFNHYKEAVTCFSKAIQVDKEKHRADRDSMKAFAAQEKFKEAIDVGKVLIDNLKRIADPSHDRSQLLHATLLQISQCYRAAKMYDAAMKMYAERLEENPEDYKTHYDILTLLADQGKSEEISNYINKLRSQEDSSTGQDKLTKLLIESASDSDRHEKLIHIAQRANCSGIIEESYQKAARPQNIKDKVLAKAAEAAKLHLMYYLASLQSYGEGNGREQASQLWEEIVHVDRKVVEGYIWWIQRQAAAKLCEHYTLAARNAGSGTLEATENIEKIRAMETQGDPTDPVLRPAEIRTVLGRYYTTIDDFENARKYFRKEVEVGIGMLSDEDPTNDWRAYYRLGYVFVRMGDDKNALAAFSLIGPEKAPPLTRKLTQTQLISSTPPTTSPLPEPSNSLLPLGSTQPLSVDPRSPSEENPSENLNTLIQSEPRQSTKQSQTISSKSPTLKGPMGNGCDGRCGKSWTFMNDMYICRECFDVQMTPDCLEKLRQGKLERVVCDKSHDYFHVPPWDFGLEGRARVGQAVIGPEEWLAGIKADRNISDEEAKEALGKDDQ